MYVSLAELIFIAVYIYIYYILEIDFFFFNVTVVTIYELSWLSIFPCIFCKPYCFIQMNEKITI